MDKLGRMKFGIFLLIFLFNFSYADVKELKLLSFYPKDIQDYYFKPIIDLATMGDMIYGIENLRNSVIAFKLEFPKIKYDFLLGKPGQGPGDLQHPFSISIWNDEIAIKESGFFSLFRKNGEYLSKFKIFSDAPTFVYLDNKIYWLNPNLEDNNLGEIYAKEGEIISTFGDKFLKTDIHAFKNPYLTNYKLYEGNMFFDGKSIFYFNSRFGKYLIFSLDGKTLAEGNISKFFRERGERIKKLNEDIYIKRVKNQNERISGYPRSVIFEDGYLHEDKIYFVSSTITRKNGWETNFELRVLGIRPMNLLKEYVIKKEDPCRLDSLAVLEKNGENYILLAITNHEKGIYLELYKE
jgi:hypothetical protein